MSDTYPTPEHGWVCFHCGETFPGTLSGQRAARLHFGASIYDEPKCQISARRLRNMEAQLRRYQEEDTDLHRQFHRLQSDHAVALRREEEKGYARGLRDAVFTSPPQQLPSPAWPSDSPPGTSPAADSQDLACET